MLVRAKPYINNDDLFDALNKKFDENVIVQFEEDFADFIGAKTCIATNSGRDALAIILNIIKLQPGDKVILPNFICEVVIDAVIHSGAIPVLVDSEKETPHISVDALANAIDKDVRVIIASHTYGMPCRIDEIKQLADEHEIILIEDCAQTLGTYFKGRQLGTIGDFALFSFNFDKPLSTGLGGILVVNHPEYCSNKKYIKSQFNRTTKAQEKKILKTLLLQSFLTDLENYKNFLSIEFAAVLLNFFYVRFLINKSVLHRDVTPLTSIVKFIAVHKVLYKICKLITLKKHKNKPCLMNNIRAFFAIKQLKGINTVLDARKRNAEFYKINISSIQHPSELPNATIVFLRYTVLCNSSEERDVLIQRAKSLGIELDNNNWQLALSQIPRYRQFVYPQSSKLVNSEAYTFRLLHLPTHFFVTLDDLRNIKMIFQS